MAYAAQVLGVKALVVMPEDASPYKKACARAYGAEVVDRGVTAKNREEVARALQEETGYALIHPFDDPLVIAGQGTAGLELLAQAGRMGVFPGAVLAPVGGGGLLAGLATAVKALSPQPSSSGWSLRPRTTPREAWRREGSSAWKRPPGPGRMGCGR